MTDAELTLLSLIAEKSQYGHEIQLTIEERGLREWLTIGFSSIFYILNKLENQGMLSSTLHANGRGPARKKYKLTPAGSGILQTAIASLLREPRDIGSGFELGLAHLHVLKPENAYHVLTHHRDSLKNQLAMVKLSESRYESEKDEHPVNVKALYSHSIKMMSAELEWLEEFIADWEKEHHDIASKAQKASPIPATNTGKVTTLMGQRKRSDRAKMIQRLRRIRPADLPTELDNQNSDTDDN